MCIWNYESVCGVHNSGEWQVHWDYQKNLGKLVYTDELNLQGIHTLYVYEYWVIHSPTIILYEYSQEYSYLYQFYSPQLTTLYTISLGDIKQSMNIHKCIYPSTNSSINFLWFSSFLHMNIHIFTNSYPHNPGFRNVMLKHTPRTVLTELED